MNEGVNRNKNSNKMALRILMRLYSKRAYILPFSLGTSHYELVANAFHYKTAFYEIQKVETFCIS
ncbi:MAG: hypothetical protein HDR52_05915 [Treponema sp.]|nr:hypothetical protein [Treponema sp.]